MHLAYLSRQEPLNPDGVGFYLLWFIRLFLILHDLRVTTVYPCELSGELDVVAILNERRRNQSDFLNAGATANEHR
ncbi:hypothetical protein O9992_03500 [Vibrio lentus]|nr:hypothetical protein [Vibrio lentus]